jgi:hypothetical protein
MKLGRDCKRFVFNCANEIAFPVSSYFVVQALKSLVREPETHSVQHTTEVDAHVPVRLGHSPISLQELDKF